MNLTTMIQGAVRSCLLLLGCLVMILILRWFIGASKKMKFGVVVKLRSFLQKRLTIAGMIGLVWFFLFFLISILLLGGDEPLPASFPFRFWLVKAGPILSFPIEYLPMWEPKGAGWVSEAILSPISMVLTWTEIFASGSFWALVLLCVFHLAARLFGKLRVRRQRSVELGSR